MSISRITDKNQWYELMGQCFETDFQQTWEYAESVKQCAGWEPVRQVVSVNDSPIAIAQVLVRELPVIGTVARIQNGPMFVKSEIVTLTSMLDAIRELKHYWVEEQGSALHITPCLFPGYFPDIWISDLGFRESKEPVWSSIRIDLKQDSELIRRSMRRTGWREPLRKAEQYGLEAFWSQNETDFFTLLDLYEKAQKEKEFSWPSVDLVRSLWGQTRESLHCVFIENQGERIAGMVVFTYLKTAYCLIAWNGSQSRDLHATNMIFWQSILHFKKMGYTWLDVGGIDPINLPGITKFKRGLHGQEYRLAGNAEAYPEAMISTMEQVSRGDNCGDIIPGFYLPFDGNSQLSDISNQVETLIQKFVRDLTGMDAELAVDESLINSGLIDSLSIVSLVQTLQNRFDIEIAPFDLTIENFDSIQRISSFVALKYVD
jgi:lipid II:glycine glycyltransferase (peptidoglycan interpeptide bridge formation enzyme)/acyl carrier protein